MARRPTWQYNWYHISQLAALGMAPVLSPFGKTILIEDSLKIQTA
jgi:hypothetical protein